MAHTIPRNEPTKLSTTERKCLATVFRILRIVCTLYQSLMNDGSNEVSDLSKMNIPVVIDIVNIG